MRSRASGSSPIADRSSCIRPRAAKNQFSKRRRRTAKLHLNHRFRQMTCQHAVIMLPNKGGAVDESRQSGDEWSSNYRLCRTWKTGLYATRGCQIGAVARTTVLFTRIFLPFRVEYSHPGRSAGDRDLLFCSNTLNPLGRTQASAGAGKDPEGIMHNSRPPWPRLFMHSQFLR
jgi:hypothetical protein